MLLDSNLDYMIYKKHLVDILQYLNCITFSHIISLDENWHHENDSGALAAKIHKGVYRIIDLIAMSSWELIPSVLQFLLSLIPLWTSAVSTIPIILTTMGLFVFITYKGHNRVKLIRSDYAELEEHSGSLFIQGIQGHTDLSANNGLELFVSNFVSTQFNMNKLDTKEANILVYRYGILKLMIIFSSQILLLYVMFTELKRGRINEGIFFANMTIINKIFSSMDRIARIFNNVSKAEEGVSRVYQIHQTYTKMTEGRQTCTPQGDICFEGITFSYEDKPVLDDVSLYIPAGTTTALVGTSGSGKTTLTKLLQRRYDPQRGNIRIGGVDIRNFTFSNLRSIIPLVSQDICIFNNSIEYNITLGNETDPTTLEHISKMCCLYDFIKDKGGFDTQVGERGLKLSGGQKQRLSIARALLRVHNLIAEGLSPIVILDEPTSALDSQTESIIMDGVSKLHSMGATIIIVAHRLATIQDADQIAVFSQGKLVEIGNHTHLLRLNGFYSDLVNKQQLNS